MNTADPGDLRGGEAEFLDVVELEDAEGGGEAPGHHVDEEGGEDLAPCEPAAVGRVEALGRVVDGDGGVDVGDCWVVDGGADVITRVGGGISADLLLLVLHVCSHLDEQHRGGL